MTVTSEIAPFNATGYFTWTSERVAKVVNEGQVITVVLADPYEDRKLTKTRVYIASEIAHAADVTLTALAAAEENLGERRFMARGEDAEIDTFYDTLNRAVMRVDTALAKTVLALFGETGEAAIEGSKFSRKAGCTMCPCSPGVVAGGMVRFPNQRGHLTKVAQISVDVVK